MNKLETKPLTLEEQLKRRSDMVKADCQVIVRNDDDYYAAMKKAEDVKSLAKGIKDYWKPLVTMAHKNHVLLKGKEKTMLEGVEAGLKNLEVQLVGYRAEREKREAERQEAEHQATLEELKLTSLDMAEEGVPQEAIDAVIEQAKETPFQAQPTQELRSRSVIKPDYIVTIVDIDEVDREFLIPSTQAHKDAIISNARAKAVKTGGKPLNGFKVITSEKINFKGAK
jgi:hypothetical protein